MMVKIVSIWGLDCSYNNVSDIPTDDLICISGLLEVLLFSPEVVSNSLWPPGL